MLLYLCYYVCVDSFVLLGGHMLYLSKKKGERKQVNIRVPLFIDKIIEEQAELLCLTKNDLYVIMLNDYIQSRGLDVKREG